MFRAWLHMRISGIRRGRWRATNKGRCRFVCPLARARNPEDAEAAERIVLAVLSGWHSASTRKSDFAGASASIRKGRLRSMKAAAARHKDATTLDRLAGTQLCFLRGILTETGALDEAMSHYKQAEAIRGRGAES